LAAVERVRTNRIECAGYSADLQSVAARCQLNNGSLSRQREVLIASKNLSVIAMQQHAIWVDHPTAAGGSFLLRTTCSQHRRQLRRLGDGAFGVEFTGGVRAADQVRVAAGGGERVGELAAGLLAGTDDDVIDGEGLFLAVAANAQAGIVRLLGEDRRLQESVGCYRGLNSPRGAA